MAARKKPESGQKQQSYEDYLASEQAKADRQARKFTSAETQEPAPE